MNRIPLNVKPTGLPHEEEEKIVRALERAGEESMRAIGCSQSFIIPPASEMPRSEIILEVQPTGLPPEEEERICQMLEATAKESMRAIGCITTFIPPRRSQD